MTSPESAPTSEIRTLLPVDITYDELRERLISGNIPVDTYGTGDAKTIEHLLSEINEGEAKVIIDTTGTVFRELNVLWTDVLCDRSYGTIYSLREDRQEFKNRRVRRRKLDSSIGEKLKPNESPEEALDRALVEELGVTETVGVYRIGYTERTFIPDSFPGIESTYRMHKYVSIIPESAFKPEGYVEYQDDKTNYYVWEILAEYGRKHRIR